MRGFQQRDPQVEAILEATKQGKINWQFCTLTEPAASHWSIDFTASHNGEKLFLKRENYLVSGGWISVTESSLKIGNAKPITFLKREDYVETLDESGAPSVSALALLVIEKFRKQKKLHWSIM